MKKLWIACLASVPITLWSAAYYVDYEQGLDSNNGLSKTAAWKHCPGMQTATGAAGTYKGQAGDVFIFKGGVVWPQAAGDGMFPLEVTYTSGWQNGTRANPVTFRCDSAWYAGNAFTRPVFDGGGTARGFFFLKYNDWFVVDGFELRNHGGNGYMDGGVSLYESAHSVIRNCYVHDWRRTGTTDGKYGGITTQTSDSILIENCQVHGAAAADCGIGVFENGGVDPEVSRCVIHNVPNGILGGGRIHHCSIYDITGSFDPAMHENGIETFSDCEVYSNLIYNVQEGVTVYLASSFSGTPGTGYFYNNVVYNCGPIPLQLDPDSATYHVYNNTLVAQSQVLIRTVPRPTYKPLAALYIKNNILINNGSAMSLSEQPVLAYDVDYNCYAGTGTIWSHDQYGALSLTAAQSHGFDVHSLQTDPSLDSVWRPDSPTDPIVDKGVALGSFFTTDLSGVARPQGGGWDMGVYEYATNHIPDLQSPIPNLIPHVLPPNPATVGELSRYLRDNNMRVYDLTGKKLVVGSLAQPGIYMVRGREDIVYHKTIIIK